MLWNSAVSMLQILYVNRKLSYIKKPIVTVFGGHLLSEQTRNFGDAAYEVAYHLATCDMFIMTGGGSGIMQKAHEGTIAAEKITQEKRCIGISVRGINEGLVQREPLHVFYIKMRTFFARKWVLMNFSTVFFFFPGGFGTLDEFLEIITLLKTNQDDSRKIVLYGKEYWQGFFDWAQKEMINRGFCEKIELEYFVIVDSIDQAVAQLKVCCGCT